MKEFAKTLKQTFQVSWQEIVVYNGIAVFGGVVGVIVALILMGTGEMEGEYATIGAMIALIIGIMIMMMVGIFSLQQDFNLAISLGKTRKHYVPARFLFLATNCLLCIITVLLIGGIEKLLYSTVDKGAVCAFGMEQFLLHPVAILGFVFLVPAIIMVGGACYIRFGAKFFWVAWVLWMVGCTSLPKMISSVHDEADSIWKRMGRAVIDFFVQLTAWQVVIGILLLGVLGIVVAFRVLRKQSVTA